MGKDRRHNNKGFSIPGDVQKMIKADIKKFKKKNDGYFDGKKEMKKAYYGMLLDLLPETIWMLVRYGHIREVLEVKDAIYDKLVDPQFIKVVANAVEDKEDIDNIKMYPCVIRDIIVLTKQQEAEERASKNDPTIEYDISDIVDLSKLILKKKLKKMKKDGVDEDVAFECLSVIPCEKVLEDKQINYKLRILMSVLYEQAKTHEIDFGKIVEYLIPEKYAMTVALFCLLERKDKFASFTEEQQKFFIKINEWLFNLMEQFDRSDIETIIKQYVETRKRDESQNRDSARRYFLKSLPEDEYPKTKKAVNRFLETNPEWEKFF